MPGLPALLVLCMLFRLTAYQTPDSGKYLLAAESFRLTGGFGSDFLLWPPLYPMLLAAHGALPAATFAALLGNLGALATLLGTWALGRRLLASPLTLAMTLLALVSVPQFGVVFSHVWSEAAFVPLSVWLAYVWGRYLEGGRGLATACVLLALAMLTRHVGVVLAIAMALTALRWKKWPALGGIALGCVPYALWIVRTLYVSGTPMGPRAPLAHPNLLTQMDLFGRVWGHWLFPHAYAGGLAVGLGVIVAFGLALPLARRSTTLVYVVLVVLGHCVLTVYSASRIFLDVDARTLFPAFAFALFVGAWTIERGLSAMDGRKALAAKAILGLYFLVWFSAPNAIINALIA
jgi:hypothetical protein